ncbi:MAG TPA: hypothetical protein VN685_10695 [Rhizomicrobium sp.]|nr:hypothetical protein [Rhizomicrobium sp.]
MLICIFRVGGIAFNVDAIPKDVALLPYRIERLGVGRAKTNALHYEIADKEPITSSELVTALRTFLTENRKDILAIRQMSGIEGLVLDVGMSVEPEKVMRSLHFDQSLLKIIAEFGISLELSVYGGGGAPNTDISN